MKTSTYQIAWLPGDGIGREVTRHALRVLQRALGADRLHIDEHLVGGAAIEATGEPLPAATRSACQTADAVLLGAVGGPAWDHLREDRRPESGLLALRKLLGAYANLRPAWTAETAISPLRADLVTDVDLLIVRELTGGIYFSEPRGRATERGEPAAFDTLRYGSSEIRRIARIAFEEARRRRGRVASVDKANVLASSQLWREVVTTLHRNEYPDVDLEHLYVDNAAMQLVRRPAAFDVIVTGNLFGDILSDLAATLPGSLGLLPSASIGGPVGLFEPVHGSAPDIAGDDAANPVAAILSGALMLDYLHEPDAARAIRRGVRETLADGVATPDIWQTGLERVSTSALATRVMAKIAAPVPSIH